jgi:hypothetical protein
MFSLELQRETEMKVEGGLFVKGRAPLGGRGEIESNVGYKNDQTVLAASMKKILKNS